MPSSFAFLYAASKPSTSMLKWCLAGAGTSLWKRCSCRSPTGSQRTGVEAGRGDLVHPEDLFVEARRLLEVISVNADVRQTPNLHSLLSVVSDSARKRAWHP